MQSLVTPCALTLLNDAGFAEYAYGLAARLLHDQCADDRTIIEHAFRICLAREPTPAEAARLLTFLAKERERCVAETSTTNALLQAGGPAGQALATRAAAPEEKAALVLLARVLFNLDEFITRE